jgi:hypothetical protein
VAAASAGAPVTSAVAPVSASAVAAEVPASAVAPLAASDLEREAESAVAALGAEDLQQRLEAMDQGLWSPWTSSIGSTTAPGESTSAKGSA